MKKLTCISILFLPLFVHAQSTVYPFWKDDPDIRQLYINEAARSTDRLINALDKKYQDDFKKIYRDRHKEVEQLLKSSRVVTAPDPHRYLQSLLKVVVDANPELKSLDIRLLFTRDAWPNAYSMGEGTLVVNAGLMAHLANESELIFILCHELAHLYLDHGNKDIRQRVETVNSESFKEEVKRLSKEEYAQNRKFNELLQRYTFNVRQHSRAHEAEADRQAFRFMQNTAFDCSGMESCLRLLDKVDDSLLFRPLDISKAFDFPEYPFKSKWIQKESVLFGQVRGDDSPLTPAQKDSMKTHPDCTQRIELLKNDLARVAGKGKLFAVDERQFNEIKLKCLPEMSEERFKEDDLSLNLYYSLVMLQEGINKPLAIYSIARDLNLAYEAQKNHTLGKYYTGEKRIYPDDYNMLLRLLKKIRLEEIGSINYHFCQKFAAEMDGYPDFVREMEVALKRQP